MTYFTRFCAFLLFFSFAASAYAAPAVPVKSTVGVPVRLDASGAIAVDPDSMVTAHWSWVTRPATSVADFSDMTALRPIVTPDVAGQFKAKLELKDSSGALVDTATVEFGTQNLTPVARLDLRAMPSALSPITLDASGSFDGDGDRITYNWEIRSAPAASSVQLASPAQALMRFTPDVPGNYEIGLRVTDSAGNMSELATQTLYYYPGASVRDHYLPTYDRVIQIDPAGPAQKLTLGDLQASGQDVLIKGFRVDRTFDEAVVDEVSIVYRGNTHFLSTGESFLAFVAYLETDLHLQSDALVSPNTAITDLTFAFENGGSITFANIMGEAYDRGAILAAGADLYEGFALDRAAPRASTGFDQLAVQTGQPTHIDPYASTDIDGRVLTPALAVVHAPTGSQATQSRSEGALTLSADTAGDYLVALRVEDGTKTDRTSMIVAVGSAPQTRPVARIADIPQAPKIGTKIALDGTQSYDFDGDNIAYSWALLSAPANSSATLSDAQAPMAAFTPDVAGEYVIQLLTRDDQMAGRPDTVVLQVEAGSPIAHAGPDMVIPADGTAQLDGSLSALGSAATSDWSVIGLTGAARHPQPSNHAQLSTSLPLQRDRSWIGNAMLEGPVYHYILGRDNGGCAYDSRVPDDLTGDWHLITLHPMGQYSDKNGQKRFVWKVLNTGLATPEVTLRDSRGHDHLKFKVPGKTAAFVVLDDLGMFNWLGLYTEGRKVGFGFQSILPFLNGAEACTGSLSTVAQLTVADARGIARADTVYMGPGNLRPLTRRGAPVEVQGFQEVKLNAAGHLSDANGDDQNPAWSIIYRPSGSTVALSSPVLRSDEIAFTPDRIGTYLVQIGTRDAQAEARPSVIVVEVKNTAPTAKIAARTEIYVGETLTLDGSGSFDPEQHALTYAWRLVSKPAQSSASITNETAPIASFAPDRRGEYVFELIVADYELSSAPVRFVLTVPNRAPVAKLEGPTETTPGTQAVYSASGSSDPDNDPLTFTYAVTAQPAGAQPQIVDLGNGSFGLTSDKSGDYTLQVTVSDGLLEATQTLDVTIRQLNRPPVLAPTNATYTVELGLELRLDLQASDPDGDKVGFFASPLPLTQGIALDSTDGALRFRPEAGQEGSYRFTIGASDGALTDERSITINVIPANAGDTGVYGTVLDAADYANGVTTPLAGVTIRLKDAALSTTTDATGKFSFGGLSAGSDQLIVEPASGNGYIGTSRSITITGNQIRDIAPSVLLAKLNEGCANVVAGQNTTLTGSVSGVAVDIPADSVKKADGTAYSGQICLGSLPRLFEDPALPSETQACQIYALQAPDAVFTSPITVTGPNLDQLPEGTKLELWQKGPNNGLYRPAAFAKVDTGAATVSATVQSIHHGTTFSFLPQAPRSAAAASEPTGNRTLTPFNGDNSLGYTLPGYMAFGQRQNVGLSYHSQAASPTLLVTGDVTIAKDASLPKTITGSLTVGGLRLEDNTQWTPRLGADGTQPALIGEAVTLSQVLPVDGAGLPSGRHGYAFAAKAHYECSSVASRHVGALYVQNQTTSPYGNGWSIDGLQKLVVAPDGKVSILDDDGVATFNPQPTLTEFDGEPLEFPSRGTQGLGIADFDQDGDLDIAFGEAGPGVVSTLTNLGARQWRQAEGPKVATPVTVKPVGQVYTPGLTSIGVGDVTNDGIPDIAYAQQFKKGFGYVTGDGLGNFAPGYERRIGGRVLDIAVNDIDADGYPDVIFSAVSNLLYYTDDSMFAYYGGATAQTLSRLSYKGYFGATPLQIFVADVDGDGNKDTAYRTTQGIDFVFNEGNRRYALRTLRAGDGGSRLLGDYAQLYDFNRDGRLDIVYSTPTDLQILLNTTGRAFADPVRLARPPQASSEMRVVVADANGDGLGDIVATAGNGVVVYRSNGDGTFQPFEEGFVNYPIFIAQFADINGDGSLDMISGSRFKVRVHYSKPSATGTFVSGQGEFSELTKRADGTWERRYKDGSKILFDANGRQNAMVDPNGNRKTYAYGPDGRLQTITDQVGGVTTFAYEANGRLETVRYPDGRVTAFTYDDAGNLEEVTEPTGSKVTFSYDKNGKLISSTNQNGNSTTYRYDAAGQFNGGTMPDSTTVANGVAASLGLVDGLGNARPQPLVYVKPEDRVSTVTDRKGQTTTVEVNQFGAIIRTVDPLGRVTRVTRTDDNLVTRVERPSAAGGTRIDTLAYDSVANLTTLTEGVGTPQERVTRYEYEPTHSRLTRALDPDGFETLYTHDAAGNVLKVTDALGGERLFTYESDGKLASRTDQNGNTTTFTYDAKRNLLSATYADGSTRAMSYDAAGNMTQLIRAQGTAAEQHVLRSYDRLNRVLTVEVTAADGAQIGEVTKYTYLPAGNIHTITDETGLVTTMSYDAMERLVAIDDPAEGVIRRSYNQAGELVSYTNGDGETHLYGYDAVGRMTRSTDPAGQTRAFAYTPSDTVASVTDGRGGITSFGYDVLERVTLRTDPLGKALTRAYDKRDNLVTLTREDGLIETATYDDLGRRTKVVTPDNTLSYAYDPRGNLTLAADADSKTSFTFDNRNRVATATTDGTVGPQPAITLTYSYDPLGRRLSMADSLGGNTGYGYDAEGRLTTLTAPWGTAYTFGYDGEGRRTSLTSTTGRDSRFGYVDGLLASLTHKQSGVTLTDLAYGYDPDGQLTQITDKLDPAKSRTISYDTLNRLTQVARGVPVADGGVPVPVEDYAYDAEGNRSASHLSALYRSNAHNQLEEDSRYSYAYDDRGNRISRTAKASGTVETYTYDSQNRLIGYTSPTTQATYAYDALDRRIAKTVNGVITAYVYDYSQDTPLNHDDIILEFNKASPADPLTIYRRWLHSENIDEPIAYERYSATSGAGSGNERTMFADRQGSIVWVTDPATGRIVASYTYDSYGKITQTQGTLTQPYGYTGREYDAESGLYYFRARSYDPSIGAFLQSDPIGFAGGQLSLYSYVASDPFNLADPSGNSSISEMLHRAPSDRANNVGATTIVGLGITSLGGRIGRALRNTSLGDHQIFFHNNSNSFRLGGTGYCTATQHAILQAEVDRLKASRPKKCLSVPAKIFHTGAGFQLRMVNLANMRRHARLALARAAINSVCYGGGDSGHRQTQEDTLAAMNWCWTTITLPGASKSKKMP